MLCCCRESLFPIIVSWCEPQNPVGGLGKGVLSSATASRSCMILCLKVWIFLRTASGVSPPGVSLKWLTTFVCHLNVIQAALRGETSRRGPAMPRYFSETLVFIRLAYIIIQSYRPMSIPMYIVQCWRDHMPCCYDISLHTLISGIQILSNKQ
jgi:hypothetical protein